MQQALTVHQLNTFVKSLLDGEPRLISICVCGEITNFKRHISSGHLYFTLNDGQSSIKCVMFKSNAIRNSFELKNGISVLCRGRVSIYEKDGTYQMYVENCMPSGIGDQLIALKLLKEKLASSEDPKAVAEEAIALAKTAIDALDKAERDIKILTGF